REIIGTRLQLIEQSHILDRDHRLVGEGVDQLDLLVGKGLHRSPRQRNDADRATLAQQRHRKRGAKSGSLLNVGVGIFGIGQDIGHVHAVPLHQGAPDDAPAPRLVGHVPEILVEQRRRETVARHVIVSVAFLAGDGGHVRLAELRGRLGKRIEYRLQVEGRAADDLEHIRGGRLLLQRFAQLVQQPRVLDGDDGLGGEIRHQLDLFVGEKPYLVAIDGNGTNQLVFFQHWNHQKGPCTAVVREVNYRSKAFDVALIVSKILDLQHLLRSSETAQRNLRFRVDYRFTLSFTGVGSRYSMHGDGSIAFALCL